MEQRALQRYNLQVDDIDIRGGWIQALAARTGGQVVKRPAAITTLSSLSLLLLSVGTGHSVPKSTSQDANAQTLERIKATMHMLGGRFRDMDTIADLVFTPPKGSGDAAQHRNVTMTAHLYIKMPDKVKFQVLQSNMPLFNRWIFLQQGDQMAAYDPISDRRLMTDFKKLTGQEPARVETSMTMLGLMFDPSRYKFQLLGRTTRQGVPVYRVRLKHLHPQRYNPLTVITTTDMFVDTKRFLPVASTSFDTKGNVATTGEFGSVVKTPLGWAPTRITITDHEFERLKKSGALNRARRNLKKKMSAEASDHAIAPEIFGHQSALDPRAFRNGTLDLWLGWGNGILFPWKMLATAPHGATSLWTFRDTKVNIGLKDSVFKL
jgi:outer membrane lipoprotein-sorting protein